MLEKEVSHGRHIPVLLFLKAHGEIVGYICIILSSKREEEMWVFSSYMAICCSGRCSESDSFMVWGVLYDFGVCLDNEPSKGQILPH